MTANEEQILHHTIFGESDERIAEILDLKLRTITDAQRKLRKLFFANDRLELCKNAVKYGYFQQIDGMVKKLSDLMHYQPLGMWEIISLHFLFSGKSEEDLTLLLKDERTGKNPEKIISELYSKLLMKEKSRLFITALASGYIKVVPVDVNDIDEKYLQQAIKDWTSNATILKVPQYKFEKSFHLTNPGEKV